jgi:voltage-gated potassium channel
VILASLAVVAYFQSVITTWLVEDVLGHRLRFRRMQKRIDQLSGHVIVAGAGSVGRHVIEELCSTDTPLVVIDRNRHVLDELSNELTKGQLLFVVGDATHDHVLKVAGIERALGIIAALTEDKDNLYVTLTAREFNPKARIVSKVVSLDAAKKIIRAGADATVAPSRIGGMRLAGEMLRPTATNFLDRMLHVREHKLRIDELELPADSWFLGKRLRELPIRKQTGVLVLAIYSGEDVAVSPDPDTILDAGMTLVVAGELDSITAVRRLAAMTSPPAGSS